MSQWGCTTFMGRFPWRRGMRGEEEEEEHVTFWGRCAQKKKHFGKVVMKLATSSCHILNSVCGCGWPLTAAVTVTDGECPETGFKTQCCEEEEEEEARVVVVKKNILDYSCDSFLHFLPNKTSQTVISMTFRVGQSMVHKYGEYR